MYNVSRPQDAWRNATLPGVFNTRHQPIMHIAIDGRALTGRFTGDRTYWRNLLRVLPRLAPTDTFTVYSRTPIEPAELPDVPNLTCRVVPAANDRVWTFATLPHALRRDRPDLVHVQYTIPPACSCPVVTTIHDISFRLFPQWFPVRDRLLLNLTIPAAMRGAARIITDSDSSRDDILRAYRVAPDKVAAIPLGLPPEFAGKAQDTREEGRGKREKGKDTSDTTQEPEHPDIRTPEHLPPNTRTPEHLNTESMQVTARQVVSTRYGLHAPFVLAVGVLQPRKNLRMLAQAFGRAKTTYGLPHSLVLAGKAGWDTEQQALRQAAVEGGGNKAAEALVFPGYVADEDLPHLYRASDAFAYPSLYEGFGFPPLEAMACGVPTLVSDAPPMPVNVGDAALVIPAKDAEAWAEALNRILTDNSLRAELARKGPVQAARFTWEATAARTLQVYREVLKEGSKRNNRDHIQK